ncbi:MAG: AAA family ATPase, partial [Chloroflexota bacterium]|nr:AAA family ATPase [Chloroflexota bacterium]
MAALKGPFSKPIVCPIVVGRAPYLTALDEAVERARRGRGQAVLVAGEAGIGKSRLVAEARARAGQRGLAVLHGACFEGDRALPYAPFLDLLRGFCAGQPRGALAGVFDAQARELVKVLPDLAPLLPAATPTPALDPASEQRRLFHAFAQLFARLAARQPTLVAVEDVHWSDDTSLELLLYLARQLSERRLLLLLTYRSDESHPGLGHALAELDRGRLAIELRLPPLNAGEVAAMLHAILGPERPVRAEFLRTLYALSEGNPFFVEELLPSLTAAGDPVDTGIVPAREPPRAMPIPRAVRDAVGRRSQRVSPAARRLLELAAVAGRRFDFALLREALRFDERTVLRLLKELCAAQLVVEETAERFAFRHALTREAIYAGLLARERQILHRLVADTLERRPAGTGEAPLADLARHCFAAGTWAKAREYARRAGEQAQELYAHRAAGELFTLALEATRQLALPPPAALHRARGRAHETRGDFEAARDDYEAALEAARAAGDRRAAWQALLDLGLLWAGRDYARTGDYCGRALALAREIGDPAILAHSLNRLGNWRVNVEQPGEALRHHREALAIFDDLGDSHGRAETLDLLAVASYLDGDLARSAAYYERAIPLFEDLGDRQRLPFGLATLALCGGSYETEALLPAAARLDGLLHHGERGLRIAREIGWRAGEAYAAVHLGLCLGSQGEYARALQLAREGLALAEEIAHRQWQTAAHCALGVLYRDLLALPPAREHLERALALAQEIGSLVWTNLAAGYLASACVAQRDLARADRALGPPTPDQTVGQRLRWLARAELALARDHPDE